MKLYQAEYTVPNGISDTPISTEGMHKARESGRLYRMKLNKTNVSGISRSHGAGS